MEPSSFLPWGRRPFGRTVLGSSPRCPAWGYQPESTGRHSQTLRGLALGSGFIQFSSSGLFPLTLRLLILAGGEKWGSIRQVCVELAITSDHIPFAKTWPPSTVLAGLTGKCCLAGVGRKTQHRRLSHQRPGWKEGGCFSTNQQAL